MLVHPEVRQGEPAATVPGAPAAVTLACRAGVPLPHRSSQPSAWPSALSGKSGPMGAGTVTFVRTLTCAPGGGWPRMAEVLRPWPGRPGSSALWTRAGFSEDCGPARACGQGWSVGRASLRPVGAVYLPAPLAGGCLCTPSTTAASPSLSFLQTRRLVPESRGAMRNCANF